MLREADPRPQKCPRIPASGDLRCVRPNGRSQKPRSGCRPSPTPWSLVRCFSGSSWFQTCLGVQGRPSSGFFASACFKRLRRERLNPLRQSPTQALQPMVFGGMWVWLKIQSGQTAGLGTHVSTDRSGNPFWNSGFLSRTHVDISKIPSERVFAFQEPTDLRRDKAWLSGRQKPWGVLDLQLLLIWVWSKTRW